MASISMAAAPTLISRCTRQAALPAAPPAASAGRACFFRGASLCAPAPRAARRQRQAACRAQACPVPHYNAAGRAPWTSRTAGKGGAAYAPLCCMQSTPLVGSEAPDFTAEAVFDQEFVTLSLSQYRVRALCALCWVRRLCLPVVFAASRRSYQVEQQCVILHGLLHVCIFRGLTVLAVLWLLAA